VKVSQRELLQKDETLLKMQADLAFLFLMMVHYPTKFGEAKGWRWIDCILDLNMRCLLY